MLYPNAIWRPTDKHGYGGIVTHFQRGLVIHSAEGSLGGLFSVLDGSAEKSWHFSMAQDGRVFQHVDTLNIAWTNGSRLSNRRFWGIECEGGGPGNFGEPLTEPQYQALVGVVRWLWETHGLTRYERQQTLWEHNEMTRYGSAATSCPSGRIPWDRLIADLEDDMLTPEEREELDQVKANIDTIYDQVDMIRCELGYGPQFGGAPGPISPLRQNLQTALDKIKALEREPTGGTYTDAQAVEAVKDKLS